MNFILKVKKFFVFFIFILFLNFNNKKCFKKNDKEKTLNNSTYFYKHKNEKLDKVLKYFFLDKSYEYFELLKLLGITPLLDAHFNKLKDPKLNELVKIFSNYLKKLFKKDSNKERWQLANNEMFLIKYRNKLTKLYEENEINEDIPHFKKKEIKKYLTYTGIFNKVAPKKDSEFEAVFMFGASAHTMKIRLKYLKTLIEEKKIKEINKIYFLCGERPLDSSIEGGTIEKMLKNKIPVSHINEAQMIRYMVDQYHLNKLKNIKIEFIIIPNKKDLNGNLKRANANDALNSFLKRNLLEKNFLVISNAPFINYQNEIIKKALKDKNINFFISGEGVENSRLSVVFDLIYKLTYIKASNLLNYKN